MVGFRASVLIRDSSNTSANQSTGNLGQNYKKPINVLLEQNAEFLLLK
jgi:hypothetical protein